MKVICTESKAILPYVPYSLESVFWTCVGDVISVSLVPVKSSLGIHFGTTFRSSSGVRTPSRLPNMEDRPRLKSMMKKSTAHTWDAGISVTASVNTMKARPVPDALWWRENERNVHQNPGLKRSLMCPLPVVSFCGSGEVIYKNRMYSTILSPNAGLDYSQVDYTH